MIAQALNVITMLGLLGMAVVLWHKGIPAAQRGGRTKAVEILLLGMVLGLFGIGRLSAALAAPVGFSFQLFGHLALLAYAALRYRRLLLPGKVLWWEVGK